MPLEIGIFIKGSFLKRNNEITDTVKNNYEVVIKESLNILQGNLRINKNTDFELFLYPFLLLLKCLRMFSLVGFYVFFNRL